MSPAEAAELLGVAEDAGIPEVQRAFLRVARQTHPDLLGHLDDFERRAAGVRFAVLREARDVLVERRPSQPEQPDEYEPYEQPVELMEHDGPQFHPVPSRGIGRSVIALILLAVILVAAVTAQNSYRTSFVEQLRGGTVQEP
jgi:hypothetical protein